MKVLFLHLSDAHFKDDTYYSQDIIKAQVQALNSIGDFNACFIMFSGDLTFSGQQNEYKKALSYLRKLRTRISEKFPLDYYIDTLFVPGNHDINFNDEKRDRTEIRTMLNKGTADELIDSELKRFDNFYNEMPYFKSYISNKLCDCKIYNISGKKLQINLINSELFASCNDSIEDDDKGLHYLPNSVWENISRKKDVDFVLTMSHRGPEWFDWSTSYAFKKHLFACADLFLYGHEHVDEIQNLCQKDNTLLKSMAQGLNFAEKSISFTTFLVDFELNEIKFKSFLWDQEEDMFAGHNDGVFAISKDHNCQYLIEPNEEYKKELVLDDDKQSIDKYYVFPGVEVENEDSREEMQEFHEFLTMLTTKKEVLIEGNDSSGKTTLLKQAYLALVGNYVPIYLNVDSIINRNPEKVLKNAFENQYSSKAIDFEKFQQIDKEKKIVLIDDLSKIKQRFVEPLLNYLFNNVGHVVCIIEPKLKINIAEQIKEKYQIEDIVKIRILPFYTSKRLELIKKNLIYINHGEYSDLKAQSEHINNFIRENIKLFSLSPRFIKMYVEYCINDTELTNSNKNVFGRVFETNLVNRIRKFATDADIDEYSFLLEEIAYQIHFNEKYPLALTDLVNIIDNYNKDYSMHVNIQKFCQTMLNAKVLVEEDNSYFFYKDSYLAYFVAKSLNTRYNNNDGNDELQILIKNICFNINGDILLFLSYITSNLNILNVIRQAAEEHMQAWNEFDIDKKNIGFVFNTECPRNETLPTETERKEKERREEKYEKTASQNDVIERENLYNYNKEDINTDDYKISQAMRFMELICKILPGFNHRLKTQEKEKIVKDIFEFPNKIIYKMLSPFDRDYDNFVKCLTCIINSECNGSVTEEDIKKSFVRAAETFALNVYDISARLSVTEKTIQMIETQTIKNTNYRIQRIMFYENLGKFGTFTDEANALYDQTNLPLVKSMVGRIVRKHFLYNTDLKIVGKVESVAKKYFGKSFKKTDLLK